MQTLDVKVFYIDENIKTEELEKLLKDGYGVLPSGSDKLIILVKQAPSKIAK